MQESIVLTAYFQVGQWNADKRTGTKTQSKPHPGAVKKPTKLLTKPQIW